MQQAVDAYEQAVNMKPPLFTSWTYRERLAVLYLLLGKRAQAERHAERALVEAPKNEQPRLRERLRSAGLAAAEEEKEKKEEEEGDGRSRRRGRVVQS